MRTYEIANPVRLSKEEVNRICDKYIPRNPVAPGKSPGEIALKNARDDGVKFGLLLAASECWYSHRNGELFRTLLAHAGISSLGALRMWIKRLDMTEFDAGILVSGWKSKSKT